MIEQQPPPRRKSRRPRGNNDSGAFTYVVDKFKHVWEVEPAFFLMPKLYACPFCMLAPAREAYAPKDVSAEQRACMFEFTFAESPATEVARYTLGGLISHFRYHVRHYEDERVWSFFRRFEIPNTATEVCLFPCPYGECDVLLDPIPPVEQRAMRRAWTRYLLTHLLMHANEHGRNFRFLIETRPDLVMTPECVEAMRYTHYCQACETHAQVLSHHVCRKPPPPPPSRRVEDVTALMQRLQRLTPAPPPVEATVSDERPAWWPQWRAEAPLFRTNVTAKPAQQPSDICQCELCSAVTTDALPMDPPQPPPLFPAAPPWRHMARSRRRSRTARRGGDD